LKMIASKVLGVVALIASVALAQTNLGTQVILSSADIQAIVTQHNQFRSNVNPTAANMQAIQWSSTLATVALNYGVQCIWAHNANRTVQANGTFSYVGENIYIGAASSVDTQGGLTAGKSWNSENASYTYQSTCGQTGVCGNCTAGQQCGHYTQIVWATTTYVGCAVVKCPSMVNNVPFNCSRYGTCTYTVCDYGKGGNYVGNAPYVQGTKCSQCPTNAGNCFNGLCTNSSVALFGTEVPQVSMNSSLTSSSSTTAAAASVLSTGVVIGAAVCGVGLIAGAAGVVLHRRRRLPISSPALKEQLLPTQNIQL